MPKALFSFVGNRDCLSVLNEDEKIDTRCLWSTLVVLNEVASLLIMVDLLVVIILFTSMLVSSRLEFSITKYY